MQDAPGPVREHVPDILPAHGRAHPRLERARAPRWRLREGIGRQRNGTTRGRSPALAYGAGRRTSLPLHLASDGEAVPVEVIPLWRVQFAGANARLVA